MNPLVSILLPVYNGEKYLRGAISSILNQTYGNYELIIINDGSTDASMRMINAFHDDRIRIIEQPNMGLAYSLNKGLEYSKGEFIARMDADDYSEPERIDLQVEYLLSHPETGVLGCSYSIIDPNDRVLGWRQQLTSHKHIVRQLFIGNPFCHGSMMFKKYLAENVGGYDASSHAEDYHLWSRLIGKTQFSNMKKCLYRYRTSNQMSLVFVNKTKIHKDYEKIKRSIWENNVLPALSNGEKSIKGILNNVKKDRSSIGKDEIPPDKTRRTERSLYTQVNLLLCKELYKNGNKAQAWEDWWINFLVNFGYPIFMAKCLKHLPILAAKGRTSF